MTVDYVAREFREAGMQDIVKETVSFSGPMAVATQWKVTVLGIPEFGAGSRDIELQSAFPMTIRTGGGVVSPSAGPLPPQRGVWSVNAPVVYVGAGSEADLATSDVRGRIAIMQIEPAPAVFFAGAARASQRLIQAGAVGVLSIYNVPGNMQLYFGNCVDAPCFNLGGEDGDFLNALIGKAVAAGVLDKLRISLAVTQEEFSGPGHVLVAKVAGLSSAENLLVSAHSDAWFAGANDNASGIAAHIALARHYAKGPKPQHDIYFFVSPGHHSPTGGTRRLVELKGALAANNIMTINLEHVAQQATYRSYFNSTRMGTSTSKYGTAYSELVPVNWDSPGRELSGGPLSPAFMRVLADAARHPHQPGPCCRTGSHRWCGRDWHSGCRDQHLVSHLRGYAGEGVPRNYAACVVFLQRYPRSIRPAHSRANAQGRGCRWADG
jgi:hypothetical protein